MSDKYPKIVILYETFSSNSGGGITLSNLFRNWPLENISNIIDAAMISQISNKELCENFYCLGEKEKTTFKIFKLFTTKFRSGKLYIEPDSKSNSSFRNIKTKKTVKNIISNWFWNFNKFTGLYYFSNKYVVSDELLNWLNEFKPDIIYSQLSNCEIVCFTNQIKEKIDAKLAVHIMDDWFTTFKNNGLLKKYWRKKLNIELYKAINNASINLSISQGMSEEYLKRFNKIFIPFHNPIDTSMWLPFRKTDLNVNLQKTEILYAGRIGKGTSESVIEIAEAIDIMNQNCFNIRFNIQTTSIEPLIKNKLEEKKCVFFNPQVPYNQLPKIFSRLIYWLCQ